MDHSQPLLLRAIFRAIGITTTVIGVLTTTALTAIELAAIALNAVWIILLENIAADK
ncbi:MAG: hypothetical protein JZU65_23970 [Chlorobium sp.]|nr:hypothetical protein [Chlorobium sp.]